MRAMNIFVMLFLYLGYRIAIDDNVASQDVNYAKLNNGVLADGRVLDQ